jgi:CelD/BcsL family acetyltransferase involved in cellulose biosynthesis
MHIHDFDSTNYNEDGNLFYSRRWLSVLEEEYGFDHKVVVSESSPQSRPIFVFSQISDIFGKRIISLPFSDYTEPLVTNREELFWILKLLRDQYPDHDMIFKYHGELQDYQAYDLENIRQACCHRVPLKGGLERIWSGTNRAFRKGVNKAKKSGVQVVALNDETGMDIFHDLLTQLRRNKFNILPQPKSFYCLFLKHFISRRQGNLWIAFKDRVPVAAALVLHSGNVMFDKMGVSDQDYLECRPNNALLWDVMKYGHTNGFDALDMGLSPGGNQGLIRFKDGLGGEKSVINYYRSPAQNRDPEQERHIKKLLSDLTRLIVNPQVHDETVQDASKMLYRYFC